jgi:peroxiredoxin
MRGRSRWAAALSLLAVGAVMLGGCARKAAATGKTPALPAVPTAAPVPVRVGADAPSFTLKTSDGKSITLADLRGKPVVLNFWASWCHFCAQEAPDLDALYRQYQPKGLQVLGVGTDDAAALKAKAEELGLTYPTGANAEAAHTYGVGGVPHTFFVDREGKITASLVGARPKAELEAEVRKIL